MLKHLSLDVNPFDRQDEATHPPDQGQAHLVLLKVTAVDPPPEPDTMNPQYVWRRANWTGDDWLLKPPGFQAKVIGWSVIGWVALPPAAIVALASEREVEDVDING